jgi:hypothetical protein
MKGAVLLACAAMLAGPLVSGCASLVAGAVGGAAAGGAASASEGESHSAGFYVGAILANVVYVLGKIVFAALGAVTSGLTYLVTVGNSETTRSVWDATVEGTYVITPRHIEGKEPVRFIGP